MFVVRSRNLFKLVGKATLLENQDFDNFINHYHQQFYD